MSARFVFRSIAIFIAVVCILISITLGRDMHLELMHGLDFFFSMLLIAVPSLVAILAIVWFFLTFSDD